MPIMPGDLVLFYFDRKRRFVQKIDPNGVLGTDKGVVRHSDVIGLEVGEEVVTSRGHRAYLLRPLPVDFLPSLRRATQVIYPKDLALIVYLSGVFPGARVLEAGVGTGHTTATLAYFVGESGLVYAVDIDRAKLEKARENLERLGLAKRVRLVHGDIRSGISETGFDLAVVDIPDPWNAVEIIHGVLKPGSPLLVFVPTVNQVEKTALAMRAGFVDVHVFEVLLREYRVEEGSVRPETKMIGHTGFVVFGRKLLKRKV